MKKYIIAAVVIVMIAVIVLFFIKFRSKDKISDGNGMEYAPAVSDISYCHGPDEYGVSTSWYLHDGQIKYRYNGATTEESIEKSCEIAIDFYNSLDVILDKYNVRSWTDLAQSDIMILDGATTTFKITFTDGTAIELGDSYEMPDNGWTAIKEIIDLFESYIKVD